MKKDPNQYPQGLNRDKVMSLIDFYENQSDADAIAEANAKDAARRKMRDAIDAGLADARAGKFIDGETFFDDLENS